jgi:hypothetical protein
LSLFITITCNNHFKQQQQQKVYVHGLEPTSEGCAVSVTRGVGGEAVIGLLGPQVASLVKSEEVSCFVLFCLVRWIVNAQTNLYEYALFFLFLILILVLVYCSLYIKCYFSLCEILIFNKKYKHKYTCCNIIWIISEIFVINCITTCVLNIQKLFPYPSIETNKDRCAACVCAAFIFLFSLFLYFFLQLACFVLFQCFFCFVLGGGGGIYLSIIIKK